MPRTRSGKTSNTSPAKKAKPAPKGRKAPKAQAESRGEIKDLIDAMSVPEDVKAYREYMSKVRASFKKDGKHHDLVKNFKGASDSKLPPKLEAFALITKHASERWRKAHGLQKKVRKESSRSHTKKARRRKLKDPSSNERVKCWRGYRKAWDGKCYKGHYVKHTAQKGKNAGQQVKKWVWDEKPPRKSTGGRKSSSERRKAKMSSSERRKASARARYAKKMKEKKGSDYVVKPRRKSSSSGRRAKMSSSERRKADARARYVKKMKEKKGSDYVVKRRRGSKAKLSSSQRRKAARARYVKKMKEKHGDDYVVKHRRKKAKRDESSDKDKKAKRSGSKAKKAKRSGSSDKDKKAKKSGRKVLKASEGYDAYHPRKMSISYLLRKY